MTPPGGTLFATPLLNPRPRISTVPLHDGHRCLVFDDILQSPDDWVEWAASQTFQPSTQYPYPGVVVPLPDELANPIRAHFDAVVRRPLGGRRTLDAALRLSIVTTRPDELRPVQWQCHRDRIPADPTRVLFAAMVLYLFHDPALGGTSFYRPRRSADETERMVQESLTLDGPSFSARYGVTPGYMQGSNDWFDRIAEVPAAYNRMICYDGGLFHSGDVGRAERLVDDPRTGRLTANGFFTCTRTLGG